MFVVKEQLGLLTKMEDEKGMCKWAILERNEVDNYIDFWFAQINEYLPSILID